MKFAAAIVMFIAGASAIQSETEMPGHGFVGIGAGFNRGSHGNFNEPINRGASVSFLSSAGGPH